MNLITPKLFSEVADSVVQWPRRLRESSPKAGCGLSVADPFVSRYVTKLRHASFPHPASSKPDVRTTTAPHLDSTSNGQKTTYSSPLKINP